MLQVCHAFVVEVGRRKSKSVYKKGPLTWSSTLMVDDGHEFKGVVNTLMSKHTIRVHRAKPGHHHSQAFIKSFNRCLAERIFHRQAQEELDSGHINPGYVKHLQVVIADMNLSPLRLTGLAPLQAISLRVLLVAKKASQQKAVLPIGTLVYLATNEEDPQTVGRRRATDPWWTHKWPSLC